MYYRALPHGHAETRRVAPLAPSSAPPRTNRTRTSPRPVQTGRGPPPPRTNRTRTSPRPVQTGRGPPPAPHKPDADGRWRWRAPSPKSGSRTPASRRARRRARWRGGTSRRRGAPAAEARSTRRCCSRRARATLFAYGRLSPSMAPGAPPGRGAAWRRGTRRVHLVREEGRDMSSQYGREGGGGGRPASPPAPLPPGWGGGGGGRTSGGARADETFLAAPQGRTRVPHPVLIGHAASLTPYSLCLWDAAWC
jgi:hypothetical protein